MAEESIKPSDKKPGDVSAPQAGPDPKEQAAIKAFFDEFVILSKKHGYDIGARLDVSDPSALRAVPMIVKLAPEKVEAKKDVESK